MSGGGRPAGRRGHRRGRWLLAGGLLGLALSPQARNAGMTLRARATRIGRRVGDPVDPFRQAPCYAHDRDAAAAASRTEAAR
ncbi:MAG TPA: hypothetical protein PKD59_04030 [Miltoncostaeaceae bacterium]|nr:hypothetical protein [Miltoncostaeaceae bacterium]